MNLYMIEPNKDADWGVYIFAPSPGKAKSVFYQAQQAYCNEHIEYTDIRAYLCKRDVAGDCDIVDDIESNGYQRVKDYGYGYLVEAGKRLFFMDKEAD